MSLLIVGSVALDSVETPFGRFNEILGGSASYCSVSASLFTCPRLVGVVGKDFPKAHVNALKSRKVDLSGLEVKDGKTFRWNGCYKGDMNCAETISVHLNVFGEFDPKIPKKFADSTLVFLANGSPAVQSKVLSQTKKARFTMIDTMNHWIESDRPALLALMKKVDGIILNNHEAFMLTKNHNLIVSAKQILGMGPKLVIIKKGEHGAMIMDKKGNFFAIPAFPIEKVKDPTGAGDSFAGGFMGYLDKAGKLDFGTMKKALICGTITASFAVEEFSLRRLLGLTKGEFDKRHKKFVEICTL